MADIEDQILSVVERNAREDRVEAEFQLLDHGYLKLVESWGSDERIVEAARMSTAKGFLGWGSHARCKHCSMKPEDVVTPGLADCPRGKPSDPAQDHEWTDAPGDEKLLRYLYEHKHATPFEMAGMVVEVQAPIFVFREWHRHRTQSYNEMSARYIPLPDVNYVPSVERLMMNSKTNKQAGTIKDAEELTETGAVRFRYFLDEHYRAAEALYQAALSAGVSKELARIHLPVGRYSRMRASANLRNWLAFLTLRMDAAAQFEIRQYANAVGALTAKLFPRTWEIAGLGVSR